VDGALVGIREIAIEGAVELAMGSAGVGTVGKFVGFRVVGPVTGVAVGKAEGEEVVGKAVVANEGDAVAGLVVVG